MRSLLIPIHLLLLPGYVETGVLLAQPVTPAAPEVSQETSDVNSPQYAESADATTAEVEDEQHPPQQAREKKLQKQKIEIGLIFTSVIVVLGVFLVVVILLYGRRLRRQVATGRGSSPVRDELWYLKHARDTNSTDDSDTQPGGAE